MGHFCRIKYCMIKTNKTERLGISMEYTSAEANKLLKKLNDTYQALLYEEGQSSTFLAAIGENPESLRPEYDYAAAQKKQRELEEKIMIVKHAINLFNTTHTVPGFSMTIDQALVYLPLLSARVKKLSEMKARMPKARENHDGYSSYGNLVDYRHINYDRLEVAKDYEAAFDELCRLQTALDAANNIEKFRIDF